MTGQLNGPGALKLPALALCLWLLAGCAGNSAPQSMLPDCDQASVEQQAQGQCIERPETIE